MSATNSVSPVTLSGAFQKSNEVLELCRNRAGRRPFDDARDKAKALYSDAIAMIRGELCGQPIYKNEESVLPIVTDLESVIGDENGVSEFIDLMRTLSKVYRVFVELRWYQPWRMKQEELVSRKEEEKKQFAEMIAQGAISDKTLVEDYVFKQLRARGVIYEQMPIDESSRDRFIKTTQKLKKILCTRANATSALFELRCARQAARGLKPDEPLWKKYCLSLIDILIAGGNLYGGDVSTIWEKFQVLASQLYLDNPAAKYTWYRQVHIMRWQSVCVKTLPEFESLVAVNIDRCKEKGGNYSLCLVKIFMELIKRPDVDQDVKDRAFRGDTKATKNKEGLTHMLSWDSDRVPKVKIKNPRDVGLAIRGVIDKVRSQGDRVVLLRDDLWETRDLVGYYLRKLAVNEKYGFKAASLTALRDRQRELVCRQSCSIGEERFRISRRLGEIQNEIDSNSKRLGIIGGKRPVKGGGSDQAPVDIINEVSVDIEDYSIEQRVIALEEEKFEIEKISKQLENEEGIEAAISYRTVIANQEETLINAFLEEATG